ncbi:P-loop containing nucleoside triphosphate hydrolase protein [Trametes elegans]|nr:P-loop containing nucleoside triphosphate hydrolase protein [Trametes elegans]
MLSSASPQPETGSDHTPVLGDADRSLLHDTTFTKTSQELIQFVTTLRALGRVYLDLPRIVVIGNQSAGKSSLVEAISGISVPRDAGTCTRCPMECRLAHAADDWSCQISIRWEYDDAGDRLEEVQEVPFGVLLTDKAGVEPMLRRAQEAILSGSVSTPYRKYSNMDLEDVKRGRDPDGGKALAFSRNTICVDLKGPDLVDLSFVDLPGIVQNAEADVVKLVEDLVTSYVDGNCLILVALPMSDDIENQKAARIAKHADPQGLRTIGVLTKPDTIPPGSTKRRQLWLDVLEGRGHPLQHGYYCTRQPDDDQRLAGITPAEARDAERAFFRTTEPWAASTCPHRYGTHNLVRSISELLTRIISDCLPRLLGEVAVQLEATNRQLEPLPPALTVEPSAFVLDLVTRFCTDVAELVEGSSRRPQLVQANRGAYDAFKRAIVCTAPAFLPCENPQKPKSKKRQVSKYVPVQDERPAEQRRRVAETKFLYLDDVREHIRASVTRELPNNIPYPAKRSLIHDFQQTWALHTTACFDRVQRSFKATLTELIRHRFERFSHLKAVIGPAVMEQADLRADLTSAHLRTILRLETAPPFTQNTRDLAKRRDEQLAQYKHARANAPVVASGPSVFAWDDMDGDGSDEDGDGSDEDSGGDTDTAGLGRAAGPRTDLPFGVPRPVKRLSETERVRLRNALGELAKLGIVVAEEDLARLRPPDAWQEELEVMAEVRAYFQVSYKRFIDIVPLSIDLHFLYDYAEALQGVLIEKLRLGSANADARCTAYVAEDPHVVALRTALVVKKRKLEVVQKALCNFGL